MIVPSALLIDISRKTKAGQEVTRSDWSETLSFIIIGILFLSFQYG